jgi:hypothetical protein
VNYSQIGTTAANVTSLQNTGLSAGTRYYYRIAAVNAGGSSAYSNVVQLTTTAGTTTIVAPQILGFSVVTASRVDVVWRDRSTNEAGFRIERSSDYGSTWTTVGTVGANATTFSDRSVQGGMYYLYRIRAYDASGASAVSSIWYAQTPYASTTRFNLFSLSMSQVFAAYGADDGSRRR